MGKIENRTEKPNSERAKRKYQLEKASTERREARIREIGKTVPVVLELYESAIERKRIENNERHKARGVMNAR